MVTRFVAHMCVAVGLAIGLAATWTVSVPVRVSAAAFDCIGGTVARVYPYGGAAVNGGTYFWGPAYKTSEYDCAQWMQAMVLINAGELCRDAGLGAGQGY